jgi:two-component system chemotaxis response regulator CheY
METPPSVGIANKMLIAHGFVSRNPGMGQLVAEGTQCCIVATPPPTLTYLPQLSGAADPSEWPMARRARLMSFPERLRALVVDDNVHARAIGMLSLRKLGVGLVDEAGDGAEAILKLLGTPYSLVLMDWYMPEVSGAGLLRVLRDQRFGPASQTPVIVMSGYPSETSLAQVQALGVTEILPKPFSIEQLSAALARALTPPLVQGSVAYV